MAYLKQGDRERAKHKLLLALSEDPESPDVQVAMAYFMEQSSEWEQARRYYKKAMKLAPGRGAYLNNYGVFLCRQGRYGEAQYYFLKAAADVRYEHTARAYENAGLTAEAAHDDKNARHYFVKALQQDPSREPSLYELVLMEEKANRVKHALFYLQQYSNMALHHRSLLAMGVRLAHKTGQFELEKEYQSTLDKTKESFVVPSKEGSQVA